MRVTSLLEFAPRTAVAGRGECVNVPMFTHGATHANMETIASREHARQIRPGNAPPPDLNCDAGVCKRAASHTLRRTIRAVAWTARPTSAHTVRLLHR